ncbi:MAG: hypothetical protein ACYDAN_02520 [Candidatus Limnocylindrales bacterium]
MDAGDPAATRDQAARLTDGRRKATSVGPAGDPPNGEPAEAALPRRPLALLSPTASDDDVEAFAEHLTAEDLRARSQSARAAHNPP